MTCTSDVSSRSHNWQIPPHHPYITSGFLIAKLFRWMLDHPNDLADVLQSGQLPVGLFQLPFL